ncbi:MAG TPA: glycoside hydrolase family 38 C-terminal domain-containing protein [Armatimonadota bacterium]
MAKDVLLIPHNHLDPVWRRAWRRPAVKGGVTVRPYAEVQEAILLRWLEMAERGMALTEGQTVVWREFLRRHPEAEGAVHRHAESGHLCIVLAGETVQDSNLPAAEGLIRNFLLAQPLYDRLAGPAHPGLRLAWLEDAFGQTPNYPQILRGVRAEAACATFYRTCPEEVWVGLDGTSILCLDHVAVAASAGSVRKHPPCPACQGAGCDACGGTGLVWRPAWSREDARAALETALAADGDVAIVRVGSEEGIPEEHLTDDVEALNAAHAGEGKNIRFATMADVYALHRARLRRLAVARDDVPTPELNPASPGCYVTRIACKQRTRAAAYALLRREAEQATGSWHAGEPIAPTPEMTEAWRGVVFNQFHDAITGTHIDGAYPELMEMLEAAEVMAGTAPPPDPAPEGFRPIEGLAEARLGRMDVTFDLTGIRSILLDGQDVFGRLPYNETKRDFRIGELVLEADFGDAWGTRIPAFWSMEDDFSQIQLGDFHTAVEASSGAIRWRGRYTTENPRVRELGWTVTACPSADGRRLDFRVEVDWDTRSQRLRAVFPVDSRETSATWEVPFGFIDRAFDADQINYSQWNAHTMDYPALHWVRKAVGPRTGVAVLNRGLPCHRWLPGRLDISLLRSPEWEFCAVEPCHYEFWDIDGQRDAGRHVLEYALLPYVDGLSEADLTREGYAYNNCALTPPFSVSGEVIVTAWKPAEDGSGWILRLQEIAGRPTEVILDFEEPRAVCVTDLLERGHTPSGAALRFIAPLHKHGILTLMIR